MAIQPALSNLKIDYNNLAKYKGNDDEFSQMAKVAFDFAVNEVKENQAVHKQSKAIELQNQIDLERLEFKTSYLSDPNIYKSEEGVADMASAYDEMALRHQGYLDQATYLNKAQIAQLSGSINTSAGSFLYDTTLKHNQASIQADTNRLVEANTNTIIQSKDTDYAQDPTKVQEHLGRLYESNKGIGKLTHDDVKGRTGYLNDSMQVVQSAVKKQLYSQIINADISVLEMAESFEVWSKNFGSEQNKQELTDEIMKPFEGTDEEKAEFKKTVYAQVSTYVDDNIESKKKEISGKKLTEEERIKDEAERKRKAEQNLFLEGQKAIRDKQAEFVNKKQEAVDKADKEFLATNKRFNSYTIQGNALGAFNTMNNSELSPLEAFNPQQNVISTITNDANQSVYTLDKSDRFLTTMDSKVKAERLAIDTAALTSTPRRSISSSYVNEYNDLMNENELVARNYRKEMVASGQMLDIEFEPMTEEDKTFIDNYYGGKGGFAGSSPALWITDNRSVWDQELGSRVTKLSHSQREYFVQSLKGHMMMTNPVSYNPESINDQYQSSNDIKDLLTYVERNINKDRKSYRPIGIKENFMKSVIKNEYNNQSFTIRNELEEAQDAELPVMKKIGIGISDDVGR